MFAYLVPAILQHKCIGTELGWCGDNRSLRRSKRDGLVCLAHPMSNLSLRVCLYG